MRKFLEEEKRRQTAFKAIAPYFSEAARAEGMYKGHRYPFCLPRDCAAENLFLEIRQPVLDYFARNEIKWHDGQEGKPSNHLCDSQVCCVNFLFPFADKPRALAALLRPIYPTLAVMLPIEDGQFVACEWIGQKNYLGEIKSPNQKRTRGANFTSADAAIMFEHADGRKQIVLIEWKYTEAYFSTLLETAASGRKRTAIYQRLFEKEDCPLAKEILPSYEALFYEPFYQFMRQQFLAHEMEKADEPATALGFVSRATSRTGRIEKHSALRNCHRVKFQTFSLTSPSPIPQSSSPRAQSTRPVHWPFPRSLPASRQWGRPRRIPARSFHSAV